MRCRRCAEAAGSVRRLWNTLGRDAMLKIHIIVETVLDRRPGGELCVGPKFSNGSGHDVSAGMADALQVGHLVALVDIFSFSLHKSRLVVVEALEIKTPRVSR